MLDWIWGWDSKFSLELLYGFGLCVLFITSGTSEYISLFIEIATAWTPTATRFNAVCQEKLPFNRKNPRSGTLAAVPQTTWSKPFPLCSLLSSARVYHFMDFGISPFGSNPLASWPVVPCPFYRFMISVAHKFDLWGQFMVFYEWPVTSNQQKPSWVTLKLIACILWSCGSRASHLCGSTQAIKWLSKADQGSHFACLDPPLGILNPNWTSVWIQFC